MILRSLVPAAGLCLLSACAAVGPDYAQPEVALAARFVGGNGSALGDVATEAWWKRLDDRRLDALVARGLAQNLDIRTSLERIRAAEAQVGTTGLNSQLSGGIGAEARRSGGSGQPTATTENGTLTAGIVFDIFGGARRGREQALGNLAAAEFDTGTVRLAFLSSLIGSYIDARYFQEALALTRQNIDGRRQTLELVLAQREIGSAADLEVAQAQAQLDTTIATLPAFESGFDASVFRIATLLAEPAAPLVADLRRGAPQPFPPAATKTGVPANLLRNRPDISASERRLAAAVAAVGVAEAQLYPSLDLTGSLRSGSPNSWGFGPSIALPIFNQGVLNARRKVAVSTARQAEIDWRGTVLTAVEDVQTAQSTYSRKRREVAALRAVVVSNDRVLALTREAYQGGSSSLLDLLDAERAAANARLSLASSVRQSGVAWASLEIATGKGWAGRP